MIVGVVGAEGIKFTTDGEREARQAIRESISVASLVVSGACHLGGIDVWAIEEAKILGIPTKDFPPKVRSWEGGYKQRNIQIATTADIVVSIVVRRLPDNYTGMRFKLCYHCGTSEHQKSGACWTRKYAEQLGKLGKTIVIENREQNVDCPNV
jgi:hypothetical protein